MKKFSILLVVALALSLFAFVLPASADGTCIKNGQQVIYESNLNYAEGGGGYRTIEIWPGHFQEVFGTYHWTQLDGSNGYWVFSWSLAVACDVGGVGVIVENSAQSSWGIRNETHAEVGASVDAANGGVVINNWANGQFSSSRWTQRQFTHEVTFSLP